MVAKIVDFSNVKEASGFNTKQVPAGDYHAKIVKVDDAESKKDGTFQYIFSIKIEGFAAQTYPYYCKLQENQLWKLRNLLIAAGMNVPKKRMKLDPGKVVGKSIGVTMEDDEYEGKAKSVVASVFPASELGDDVVAPSDDDDDDVADDVVDDDMDDMDDIEEPKPKAKAKAAAPVEDDEEEEEEEEEADEEEASAGDKFDEMDRNKLKRFIKSKDADYSVKRSQSDDDLREVARGLEAPAAKAEASDDDELDELDIDDL